ncbi:MAG TPA: DUF167 domain-containing protein [Spirochaetota bacterium]|nr:DUF167 domain-containing protein [Spirochaetota bacterium]HOS38346.1 DUF167 domain-containing protein [Spirochaetota bacterium]HPI21558.1 DUF167 domain-containing protein [Spirochaetota bacterium]HPU89047.1 DUF167 domain-containing protein [Spirochaetota bacterium]
MAFPPFIYIMQHNTAYIDITVKPRSSRRMIRVEDDSRIVAFINAPPVDGKANEECIELFSDALGIAKSRISIFRGHHGRRKTLAIDGESAETVLRSLRP